MNSRSTRHIALIARLAITLGATWLVFKSIDWTVLSGLFARADFTLLALAGVVRAVQFAVMVWRWHMIIEKLSGVSVARVWLAIGLGRSMLLGQPLPSTVGPDIVRAIMVSNEIGLAIAARSVICDRIVGFAALIGLVVASVPFLAFFGAAVAALVALGGVLVGILAVLAIPLAGSKRLADLPWIGTHSILVLADIRQMFGIGRFNFFILLLSLLSHLLSVLLVYELARAVASPISLFQCLVIVPVSLLISAVPISIGGWGVREGALAVGFTLVGASSEAGVATSILFGLTGPLIGVIAEAATPLARVHRIPTKDVT